MVYYSYLSIVEEAMDAELLIYIIFGIYAALFGIVIGSFLNVVIYRLPAGRTIAKGHSMCMSCGHTLAAKDLVPLFSWLFLKGKCRYCGAPVASRYAKIESLTGAVFLLTAILHRSAGFVLLMDGDPLFLKLFFYYLLFVISSTCVISAMMIRYDTQKSFLRLGLIPLISGLIASFISSPDPEGVIFPLLGSAIVIAVCAVISLLVNRRYIYDDLKFDLVFAGMMSFSGYLWLDGSFYMTPAVFAVLYGLLRAVLSKRAGRRYDGIIAASGIVILLVLSYFIIK